VGDEIWFGLSGSNEVFAIARGESPPSARSLVSQADGLTIVGADAQGRLRWSSEGIDEFG
jgi:hypothetical protein